MEIALSVPALSRVRGRAILGPLFLTAVLHLIPLAVYLGAYRGDLSSLVCTDAGKIGRWPFEAIHVGFGKTGYDGQYYYVLARQPWHRYSPEVLDSPSYRHARILYPALAWLVSRGDPELLLWVLPAINLFAIIGLAWLGSCLALHYHRSPWWGCVLPLILNAGMPALRDLTDPLATMTIVGVLTAYLLEWPVWQLGLWAVCAVLCREQNALILFAVMGDAVLKKCWRPAMAVAFALLLWSAWFVTLRLWYGNWPVAANNIALPFSGIWYCSTHLNGAYGRPAILNVIGMSLLLTHIVLSGIVLARGQRLTAAITLAGVLLALMASVLIYQSSWSYVRVFLWMPLGIWLWTIESGRKWPIFLLLPGMYWFLIASVQPWIG